MKVIENYFAFQHKNPTMTKGELAMIVRRLRQSRHYLEYGGGFTTYYAVQVPELETITTVESDRGFLTGLLGNPLIKKAHDEGRFRPVYADVGPTQTWGNPVGVGRAGRSQAIIAACYRYPYWPFEGDHPDYDIVLQDGIVRRITLATIFSLLPPTVPRMVHDYWGPECEKRGYRTVEAFHDVQEVCDSLVCLMPHQTDTSRRLAEQYLRDRQHIGLRW